MASIQKRNTIQRQLVSDAVHELKNHPTAEDIYQRVILAHPTISRGTVYRNLNYLVEDGFIQKVSVFDGADRFDFTIKDHHHIKCTICEQVFDMMPEDEDIAQQVAEVEAKLAQSSRFEVTGYKILFTGVCPECQSKRIKN